jgi:very-short-patch-repair endonuclease
MLNTEYAQNEQTKLKVLHRKLLINEITNLGWIGGELDIVEFLKQTWDLDNMPSTDSRFANASGDIWQHMVNNDDWEINYLFGSYLGLYDETDNVFFRFIESIVHPLVRLEEEQDRYVQVINRYLSKDGYKLQVSNMISGYKIYRVVQSRNGVAGEIKNLIFAANGPKPEIVLDDTINNNIRIVRNAEFCLIYDQPIPQTGLRWTELVTWWGKQHGEETATIETSRKLFDRLRNSLSPHSMPERLLFNTYFEYFYNLLGEKLPALVPQVYLHYDPYTVRELYGKSRLVRQRMDFLILFSNSDRVVIEVDGKQHYTDSTGEASPQKYAELVEADRQLRLAGYEVYRFGGYELKNERDKQVIIRFFYQLFKKYNLTVSEPKLADRLD